jgi:hypothetical protein
MRQLRPRKEKSDTWKKPEMANAAINTPKLLGRIASVSIVCRVVSCVSYVVRGAPGKWGKRKGGLPKKGVGRLRVSHVKAIALAPNRRSSSSLHFCCTRHIEMRFKT